MPDNYRSYKVLLPVPRAEGENPFYEDIGNFERGTAEASIVAALESQAADVKPDEAIAVPVGNWNECEVEEDPRPRFKVRRRANTAPETQPTSPHPDDAT